MSALYLLERIGGHRRRGVAVVLTAVLVVVLFGMVALTFDVGYLSNIRADLQHVADGTSLAGASAIGLEPDVIRARVHEYATKYRGLAKLSLADSDIVLGTWDANNGTFTPVANEDEDRVDAVRVFAEMSVARGNPAPLFFGTIFGKQLTNVSASATASFATGVAWNVVIVQDVTSSFKDDIPEARVADQALVDCIRDKAGGDTLVGLVTFTGYGQVVSPLEEVEASYDFISAAIAALDQCGRGSMPPCSGTNIAAGLVEATDLLKGVDSDLPPAIILVSDGQPNASSSGPPYSTDELRDLAVAAADEAAAEGISIFALFFTKGGANEGGDFVESLIRGKGTYHETPSAAEMTAEMFEICLEGIPLALVE